MNETREKLDAAIAAAEVALEASRKKGLRLEAAREALKQIAALPLGDHQAKRIAETALRNT